MYKYKDKVLQEFERIILKEISSRLVDVTRDRNADLYFAQRPYNGTMESAFWEQRPTV